MPEELDRFTAKCVGDIPRKRIGGGRALRLWGLETLRCLKKIGKAFRQAGDKKTPGFVLQGKVLGISGLVGRSSVSGEDKSITQPLTIRTPQPKILARRLAFSHIPYVAVP